MRLYWHPFSLFPRRVRIAVREKGIACEEVEVDLPAGATREAEFRRLNPFGQVPVLQDDGLVIYESLAILEYLEERYQAPALLAPDAEEWLEAAPEPVVHYVDREARIAMFTPQAWRERYAAQAASENEQDCARLERAFAMFQARQRQFAALLEAHGIPVTFVHCDVDADSHAALA